MVLIMFFSSRISPFTSTVIFFDRSPLATAVVTSAIFRTCAVRLPAIEVTESVTSRPGHALDARLHTQLPFGAHLAGHAGDFGREGGQLIDHGVDGVFQLQD